MTEDKPAGLSAFDLAGRSVLVTGAGRGLGRSMALAVASAGATVIAVARTVADLNEVADLAVGGRVLPLPWDLAELSSLDALADKAADLGGPLSGVVHAAGVQHRLPATQFSVADWRKITALDLDAPFFLSTAVHRSQAGGNRCSHVFVGSLASSLGIKGISAYAASKSGLLGVVRTLAVEWADAGVRVNCLAPGYFRTELTADLFSDAERTAWVLSRIPMGRIGIGEDLSGTVIFLLSDASNYVTGQVINVDGGWLSG
jgi:2-dehydro-3-deoxy-D-gluconate 5-dehydrogenase